VRKWLAEYFGATRTHWEKTSIGFVVSGDWAFERYAHRSTDTAKNTGAITTDTGKGINIFRRGSDGPVARRDRRLELRSAGALERPQLACAGNIRYR